MSEDSGNACNLSGQDLLPSCVLSKNTEIKIYRTILNDKHQPMHFTFNNILVQNADFNIKIHKNTLKHSYFDIEISILD